MFCVVPVPTIIDIWLVCFTMAMASHDTTNILFFVSGYTVLRTLTHEYFCT